MLATTRYSAFGGSGRDSLLGDGPDLTSTETGNDVIQGQGGDDTILGGRGTDTLNGGQGSDLVSSSFLVQGAPPQPRPPPPPPPPPPTLSGGAFQDAVDSGLGTDTGSQNFTLSVGTGDGSLVQPIDSIGLFFSSTYDPIGPIAAADASFESDVYIRQGVNGGTGNRQSLSAAATNISTIRANGTTEANSTFDIGTLSFALTQTVVPTTDISGNVTGALLTQTYRVTNNAAANSEFELVRYYDGDRFFDGTLIDGGGRLITSAGDEILFETDSGGTTASTTFVGITGKGGTIPLTNRFEIDRFPVLRTSIGQGNALRDSITGDANQGVDLVVDPAAEINERFALSAVMLTVLDAL